VAIESMTGFGRGESVGANFVVTSEIKSVNNRFKDFRFRLPSAFSALEMNLREKLNRDFKRGTFDVFVGLKKTDGNAGFFDFDDAKAMEFISKLKKLSIQTQTNFTFAPSDFLRAEFGRENDESLQEQQQALLLQAFQNAVASLKESRSNEGAKLIAILKEHLENFKKNFNKVKGLAGGNRPKVEERLRQRFQEFSKELQIDTPRFLQEVVYYLEKLDIHEEINRIETHLSKLNQLMDSGDEVGRQVDFLIQELNRETNTIGSKSSDAEISDAVVEMKVQLEKIREQGLNLE